MVSILVGFYSVFIRTEMWNWFAEPLLHVSESSYWLMYGVSMLFGLMTGASDGEQENPVHERRWKSYKTSVTGQKAQPLPSFNQFFVGERSYEPAVFVFIEFAESNRAGHRDTREWSRRGRERDSSTESRL